jgi:hypothetical protein
MRQALDTTHASLACAQCHPNLETTVAPACGDAACHKDKKIDYPTQRPGPVATIRRPVPVWSRLFAAGRGRTE